ncbi:MFS general substrate transporter [Corynespora cassiicola Philippines]|uniref:MFS general substrate transporter n=1 Tax=Corynespora cassiicola Philippines TaxID=1448308 RepID=A0A2T2P7V5_CORCC|nr:MFS general substrate transporter [Corynespora cassiicola Philippines]
MPFADSVTETTREDLAATEEPASWRNMPNKLLLSTLAAARITELFSERSHAAYMFYQIRSFSPESQDSGSHIAAQSGILLASWAAAQSLTAMWWGRVADSPKVGRKQVILIGLTGTAMSTMGIGFSRSFFSILIWKILAGGLNTNLGIMRSMIGEAIEHRFQSRAFLLLPMCLNVGELFGPLLGGFLTDPSVSINKIRDTSSQGTKGSGFKAKFPYALPNLTCALLIGVSALVVIFALEETHPALQDKQDRGRRFGKWVYSRVLSNAYYKHRYQQLPRADDVELSSPQVRASDTDLFPGDSGRISTDSPITSKEPDAVDLVSPTLGGSILPRIVTRKVTLTLYTHHILMLHFSTFMATIPSFLSAPRSAWTQPTKRSILHFSGGLEFSSGQVGIAMSFLGLAGLLFQLLVYPAVISKIGSLRSYRIFLLFSALSYILLPFLTLLPEKAVVLWPCLAIVLVFQALSRTFALPCTIILVNNCSPEPSVRGTIHGLALSLGSAARILGPLAGGWALGLGLEKDMVWGVWWCLSALVGLNYILISIIASID